ncbi:MAG: DUF1565 domain-containing protein [Ruminococcaceae bacterium]|nr:DUF1565 domain-containing protein [Oscillospiraceae bacterium]
MNKFYVSINGNDNNTGSVNNPFRTIEKAQEKARECSNATVYVLEGVYNSFPVLSEKDNGTSYIGVNATLSGGMEIDYENTLEVPEKIKDRLKAEVKNKVRAIGIDALGIDIDAFGEIYPIGAYHTAQKYDNAKLGTNFEVFSGGRRMRIARYPDEGFLKIDEVFDVGDVAEFPDQNYWHGWAERRNHRGGCYIIDRETNYRVQTWKNLENIWIFGYFKHDWADSSAPVKFDTKNRAVYPEHVARFGCKKGADYYFYNILEELDAPGEYFLDKENKMLYIYPYSEGDKIEFSLNENPIVEILGGENITIEGFTIKCARNSGIKVRGNGCTIKNNLVKNVSDHGIVIDGYRNTVENNEVTRTGKGGIYLYGGDRITLTPSENKAVNNYIHHYSEVYKTYQPGVQMSGVGSICTHNEICFCPHEAIQYDGNDHLIEYNNIHDAVLYSADAGAIYTGRDWAGYGTVIRYNIIRDIGNEELRPDAIYWDDAHSGQTAYGNIIINAKKYGFQIGGGRDNTAINNIIIGETDVPLRFDCRAYEGFFEDGWYREAVNTPDGEQWRILNRVPYRSEIWAKKYPSLAALSDDFNNTDDINFPVYPAGNVVENNIVVNSRAFLGEIMEASMKYSSVKNNKAYKSVEDIGFDMNTLKFEVQPEDFPEIPVDKIGRIEE